MRNVRRIRREKGSALLVSLMVMVGLSLLGLAFVAISETESAISVNQSQYVQAQTAAEAGAAAVVEMFQDADWALDRGILPPNNNAIKTLRRYSTAPSDYYKSSASMKLFAYPFKPASTNRFYGSETTADVWIDASKGKIATDYLDQLNKVLFQDPTLKISAIRVYAPPIPNATLNTWKFWEGGTRFGVATIRVTAQKVVDTRVLAERTVKYVVAETPFPTVDGAIETSGSLVGQGNFHVYWGKVLSEKDLQLARPAVGMPWMDPKEVLWFNYGYDTTEPRALNTLYNTGARVHASPAALLARPELKKFSYVATTTGTTLNSEPDPTEWGDAIGETLADGGVTWKAEPSRPYPLTPGDFAMESNWLYQLIGQTIEDPWLHARSRGALTYNNNNTVPCSNAAKPHPCDYDTAAWPVSTRYSNFFQLQNTTNAAMEQEEVFFPTMEYEFWKSVAKSGSNSVKSGVYYFKYVGDGKTNLFQGPGGQVKDIEEWLNAFPGTNGKPSNGLQPGFYFFDTQNGKNPQFNKGGVLTPPIMISAAVKSQFQMQGYIYLNAESFGTTGQGNITPDDVYNMPGEPFRDIGHRLVDGDTKKWVLTGALALPDADFQIIGSNNGIFDCQELNGNNRCDIFVAPRTIAPPNGDPPFAAFLPVPWFEGCTPGANGDAGANCSEPHEPFLNMMYPSQNNPKGAVTVGWYDPDSLAVTTNRRPKKRTGQNTTVTCAKTSTPLECTSNGYDEDGAMVTFAPLLVGALYNEGGYDGSGNATYYGSLLMRGSFNSSGTPDVFFNECLARGCLERQLKMQRVMITSVELDQ
jgi:hypothetical protein